MASAAFIALAVVGWDLPIKTVLAFLVICVGFLVLIVALAALTARLLRWRRDSNDGDDI